MKKNGLLPQSLANGGKLQKRVIQKNGCRGGILGGVRRGRHSYLGEVR